MAMTLDWRNALAIIREKQDPQGRWLMEYDYTGKTWVDFGAKKQPNKWVTLRALRVLKAVEWQAWVSRYTSPAGMTGVPG